MLREILNMDGVTILSKKQQSMIAGSGGTCAFQGGNGYAGISGVSKEQAIAGAGATGGHWCCDSCNKATWLDSDHKAYLSNMQ